MALESLSVDGQPVNKARAQDRSDDRESISELVSRIIADAKGYVTAQVEVVKQTASTGLEKGGVGVGMIVGAGLLAYAAVIILLVAIFTWLNDMIGPIGAGLIVVIGTLLVAFLLFKLGISRINQAKAAISGKRI